MNVPLLCLGGQPAPEAIQLGWIRYEELAAAAQAAIWNLVAEGLAAPTASGFEARFEELCGEHELDPDRGREILRTCGLLLGQATALDLTTEQFAADLEALSRGGSGRAPQGSHESRDAILPRFESLKTRVRQAMALGTLTDHGKVLVGVDWRVDRVASSNRATRLETDVVFLTLRYQEGDASERITFQLTTPAIQELKSFLERLQSL